MIAGVLLSSCSQLRDDSDSMAVVAEALQQQRGDLIVESMAVRGGQVFVCWEARSYQRSVSLFHSTGQLTSFCCWLSHTIVATHTTNDTFAPHFLARFVGPFPRTPFGRLSDSCQPRTCQRE